jgi:hypothetical protein
VKPAKGMRFIRVSSDGYWRELSNKSHLEIGKPVSVHKRRALLAAFTLPRAVLTRHRKATGVHD